MTKGFYGYANKDRRYTRGWFQKNSGSILKSFLLKVSLSTLKLAVIKTKDRYCPASFKFCLGWSSFNSPMLYFVDLFQVLKSHRVEGHKKKKTSSISFQAGFILPKPIVFEKCYFSDFKTVTMRNWAR